MSKRTFPAAWAACLLLGLTCAAPAAPRLSTLSIPGPKPFQTVARDVMDVACCIDPSMAANVGLFDDANRVPMFNQAAITMLETRLHHDLDALRHMPWRRWPVPQQVDFRWVYANAETADRMLSVEKMYRHRPGCWLEPTANTLIALVTYAPKRLDLQATIYKRIPSMVADMQTVCNHPTQRDVDTAEKLIDAIVKAAPADARTALLQYKAELQALQGLPEFEVIGADNYAWRLKHAMLLPWTPDQLLDNATRMDQKVNAEDAVLKPKLGPDPKPTEQQVAEAKALTRDSLLALYNAIPQADRQSLLHSGVVSIPATVGPIYARETPDAMVPLTGDGGSMNPPPPFGPTSVGYWNVEHFHADWTLEQRLEKVLDAENFRTNGMGPYAAHEGVPGHHLQLSIARTLSDPIRTVLQDSAQEEGWALYAEEMFWQSGGLGTSPRARYNTLRSFQHRIHRVVYDVNIETGRWTLQQGADYRHATPAGQGRVDEDLLRSINWPTQLISYYSGKEQIVALKADYKKKMGSRYTDRAFHDALLKVGCIPIVFARSELLGEPVPGL